MECSGSLSRRVDLRTQGGATMEPEAQRLVDAAVTLFRMSGAPLRCCVSTFVIFVWWHDGMHVS